MAAGRGPGAGGGGLPAERPGPGAGLGGRPGRLFPIWHSVPPEPHPTLVAESYRLERCPRHAVMIERQAFTGSDVLREHEDGPWLGGRGRASGDAPTVFGAFRRRLLRQMERRRWGAALTDFTIAEFFCSRPPAVFVAAMARLLGGLDGALGAACGRGPKGGPSVGELYREGAIRLIFKGGNPQALMRLRCLELLPPAARRALDSIRPTSLSDIDVMLALDTEARCLREDGEFERIHRECTAVVEEALHGVVMDVQALLRRGGAAPAWRARAPRGRRRGGGGEEEAEVFARLLQGLAEPRVAERATEQVRRAARELRGAVGEALEGYGLCAREALAQLRPAGCLRAQPWRRRSRRIAQDTSGRGIELLCYGPRSQLFVSSSAHVEFKDVRCIEENDMCRFGLVRLFLGFRLDFELEDGSRSVESRYSRGEVFDVSIPKREDVSLKIMCQHENSMPGSALTLGELSAGRSAVRLHVMTLDALIDENYDLTFGRNVVMDDPCIWRIPKVRKRLIRLMELLGIKVLTLRGHSWQGKGAAFARLAAALRDFCVTGAVAEASSLCQVCVQSRIEGCLLHGFRIFARALRREKDALPADAWKQIGETVAPVAALASQFAVACGVLEGRPGQRAACRVEEQELYRWPLGSAWALRAEPAAAEAAEGRRRPSPSPSPGPAVDGQRTPARSPSRRASKRRRCGPSASRSRERSRSSQAPSRSSFSWA